MKLNPEQHRAATLIEGPSIVNAGPGTGKTQVIAIRIQTIIEEADVDPHNILCLTFSNAGAVAMKKRLVQILGPAGYRVHVYTFHGFANRVLQENPDLIGVRDVEPALPIDQMLAIRDIIDSLDQESPLRRKSGQLYYWEVAMKNLYSIMKSEDWSYETVKQAAEEYIADLPNNEKFVYKRKYKQFNAGDPKPALIKEETEKMARLVEAAKHLESYNQALRDKGMYDYDDMLKLVTDAFDKNSWLLRRYEEQYLYYLVDEFQDTNGIQMKLLNQLTKYWREETGNPNTFVVGDDDQALYEFQGARLKNMVDFVNQYPDIQKTVLTKNYRSRQFILDVAQHLIEHNQDRLINEMQLDKNYQSMVDSKSVGDPVKVIQFETIQEEMAWVVHQLKKRKDLSEVAIIYSKHKQADELIRLLVNNGIPYNSQRTINALATSTWRMLSTMLMIAYTNYPQKREGYVYDLASFHFVPGSDKNLFRHIIETRIEEKYKRSAYEVASDIEEFSSFLKKIRTAAAEMTIHDALDVIIFESGFGTYCKQDTRRMQELISLMKFVKQYSLKNPYAKYPDLAKYIKTMQDNNVPLPVEVIIKDTKGVNLMSAHASKGLEYDKVYMIDCTSTWEPSKNNTGKFPLPETLLHSKADTTEEAARRAFFVAITRARKECYITYSNNNGLKDTMPAIFVEETGLEVKKARKSTYVEDYYSNYFENNTQLTDMILGLDLEEKVQQFVWSVSALNTFIESPWTFFCKYVLKIPENEPHKFIFGNVIHEVYYDYVIEMRRQGDKTKNVNNRKYASLEDLHEKFTEKMEQYRANFTKTEFEAYMARGTDILNNYTPNQEWTIHARAEQSFRNIEVAGIPIKCIVDRLDFKTDTDFDTIDYKTGKYDYKKFKRFEGSLWRQAVFYKMCIIQHQVREAWYCDDFYFHFLELDPSDKKKVVHVKPEQEDMHHVIEELKEADKRLKALDIFEPGEVDNKYVKMLEV